MPELAEVDFHRRRWDVGHGGRILRVTLHPRKRVFDRETEASIKSGLTGTRLVGSQSHGKQMLFRFNPHGWLGLHLGMTGELRVEPADFMAGVHDHLVLHQAKRALVFRDPRRFGRVRFHHGPEAPGWWSSLPPALLSNDFSVAHVAMILRRRARAPIKAVLLMQAFFPGIGNWMADEILWRIEVAPRTQAGRFTLVKSTQLWREIRHVARVAMRTIGRDYSDPPGNWLFHERWTDRGRCPRHKRVLRRETIGGRTTAWCPSCQR